MASNGDGRAECVYFALFVSGARMATSPFPWLPMLAISIGLVSHSYALTSLFPYVGYMVQHLGITDDKDEAGQSLNQHSLETELRNGNDACQLSLDVFS